VLGNGPRHDAVQQRVPGGVRSRPRTASRHGADPEAPTSWRRDAMNRSTSSLRHPLRLARALVTARSGQARVWPIILMGCLAATGLVGAQRNSVHPQPRADALPAPAKATANQNKRVPQPDGTLPRVPAGFTVASYAELRGPRMMVYAPNGDLFVSSPSTNSIFVLRDANHDGVFESRGVFADGKTAPAPPPPPAPADGRPAPVLGVLEGPQSLVPNPAACTPPPDYRHVGPGGLRLPFRLAFHGDYLYVGNTDSIVRFPYRTGDLEMRSAPEKLLD